MQENAMMLQEKESGSRMNGGSGADIDDNLLLAIEEKVREEMDKVYQDRLEEQIKLINDKSNEEIEKFYDKVQMETEELLLRKGITKERQREIEQEVREECERKFSSSQKSKNIERESHNSYNNNSQQGDMVYNTSDGSRNFDENLLKIDIRSELEKEYSRKDRLMKVNNKRRMEEAKKAQKEELEKEYNLKLEETKKESERERCEIARLKSIENIRLKKLKDVKKETENQLQMQRLNYEKVIKDLKEQVNIMLQSQQDTNSQSRINYNDNSSIDYNECNDKYNSTIKDELCRQERNALSNYKDKSLRDGDAGKVFTQENYYNDGIDEDISENDINRANVEFLDHDQVHEYTPANHSSEDSAEYKKSVEYNRESIDPYAYNPNAKKVSKSQFRDIGKKDAGNDLENKAVSAKDKANAFVENLKNNCNTNGNGSKSDVNLKKKNHASNSVSGNNSKNRGNNNNKWLARKNKLENSPAGKFVNEEAF